jgi:hypothetical protein
MELSELVLHLTDLHVQVFAAPKIVLSTCTFTFAHASLNQSIAHSTRRFGIINERHGYSIVAVLAFATVIAVPIVTIVRCVDSIFVLFMRYEASTKLIRHVQQMIYIFDENGKVIIRIKYLLKHSRLAETRDPILTNLYSRTMCSPVQYPTNDLIAYTRKIADWVYDR